MIAINKSQRNIPDSLSNLEYEDSLNEVINLSDPKHKNKIDSSIYRADDVYLRLKNLYHNKCAYCETYVSEPEIEHYRPKKQINGVPRAKHKGYYWLAYEWTNLLPACHDCNKNGVKGNHFPVEGSRRNKFKELADGSIDLLANNLMSDYLQDEKPLFLNPETPGFDPFFYFKFNSVGRFLPNQPQNTFEYKQADKTIEIVQLNGDRLYANYRKKQIKQIFSNILKSYHKDFLAMEISENYFKRQVLKILDGINKYSKPDKEYSFFWNYLYENFPFFVTSYFKVKHRHLFLKIYREHKNNLETA